MTHFLIAAKSAGAMNPQLPYKAESGGPNSLMMRADVARFWRWISRSVLKLNLWNLANECITLNWFWQTNIKIF